MEERLSEMEIGAKKQEAEYFAALQKHSIGLKNMKSEVNLLFFVKQIQGSFIMTSHKFKLVLTPLPPLSPMYYTLFTSVTQS